MCWNGILDKWEECDPKDLIHNNWWSGGCSSLCTKIGGEYGICNSEFNWKTLWSIVNSSGLCLTWYVRNFSFNAVKLRWNWSCVDSGSNLSVDCFAVKSVCWDGYVWWGKVCENCSEDLKDICLSDGKDKCKCEECSEKLKDICITDGKDKCKCEECSEKLKDICLVDTWNTLWWTEELCPNGRKDPWENCENCPEDLKDSCVKPGSSDDSTWWDNKDDTNNGDVDKDDWNKDGKWEIENNDCNICPCEYVDFSTNLTRWDTVRAKLWDKALSVFYRYSNTVSVESFLDLN